MYYSRPAEWSYRELNGVPTRTAPNLRPQYWCRKTFWTNIPGLDPDATMELVETALLIYGITNIIKSC